MPDGFWGRKGVSTIKYFWQLIVVLGMAMIALSLIISIDWIGFPVRPCSQDESKVLLVLGSTFSSTSTVNQGHDTCFWASKESSSSAKH